MLVRRFVTGIRNQDWSAVFVELVIVVAGVFFGIQASNWNAGRLEQENGRLIAQRLVSDLRKDLDSRQTLVRYYQAVLESAERTAMRLNDDTIGDPNAFIVDAYRATEYIHRPQTRASFDEIISSGNLGLLPVSARDAGLIEYFRVDNSSLMREAVRNSPYRTRIRRLLPYDIQSAIRSNCSDTFDDRYHIVGFAESCESGVPAIQLEQAASALFSDAELVRDLRLHLSVLKGVRLFRGEIVDLEATISALDDAQ